ncbi:hypothetical protein NP569_25405, partial [Vibrio parahaemolyticus]|nr:hypothetical protein [Vibrio parahaemolyticus]
DEFIESVGHELRTPLTSLSLTVQILAGQREMTPALAQVMRESVGRLEALVDRVLTFDERAQHALSDQSTASGAITIEPLLNEVVSEYA